MIHFVEKYVIVSNINMSIDISNFLNMYSIFSDELI